MKHAVLLLEFFVLFVSVLFGLLPTYFFPALVVTLPALVVTIRNVVRASRGVPVQFALVGHIASVALVTAVVGGTVWSSVFPRYDTFRVPVGFHGPLVVASNGRAIPGAQVLDRTRTVFISKSGFALVDRAPLELSSADRVLDSNGRALPVSSPSASIRPVSCADGRHVYVHVKWGFVQSSAPTQAETRQLEVLERRAASFVLSREGCQPVPN